MQIAGDIAYVMSDSSLLYGMICTLSLSNGSAAILIMDQSPVASHHPHLC
jgi:hypothetical protein